MISHSSGRSLCPILTVVLLLCASASAQTAEHPIFGNATAELVNDEFELADGAAWDGGGRLFVPDVRAQELRVFNTRNLQQEPKIRIKGVAISGTHFERGKVYFTNHPACRIGVAGNKGLPKMLVQFPAANRPNDLTVDSSGNVFVTFTGQGLVRKVTPGGVSSILVGKLNTPNGIAISPDSSTLYASSAKTGKIYRMDLLAKTVTAKSFAQLPETNDGFRGDGMCVDRAGNVYVTGAESVFVFDQNGKQMDSYKTIFRPINAVLGGADGRQLFLSTFGGLFQINVAAYGVSPTPPDHSEDTKGPTSSNIPDSIDAQLNIVYANIDGRKLLMDVFRPKSGGPAKPAVVVVHGGGWLKGDKTKFRALALRLAEKGYVTAAIEYRLGFESRFPAAIRDCNAATTYLRENAGRFEIDPNRIGAVGGSAGGHLVGLMAAGQEFEELRHASDTKKDASLKSIAVLAGPFQIKTGSVAEKAQTSNARSNAVRWFGGTIGEVPQQYDLADVLEKITKKMPPTLFISGSLDNPERNKPSREKMDSLGVPNRLIVHPNASHGHWNSPDWIQEVVDDIDAHFNQYL